MYGHYKVASNSLNQLQFTIKSHIKISQIKIIILPKHQATLSNIHIAYKRYKNIFIKINNPNY